MSFFESIFLSKEPKIKIVPERERLDQNLEAIVDDIWKKEMHENGTLLHNGTILSFVDFDGEILELEITQYKYFIAQLRDPNLIEKINIFPIGVTGITTSGEFFLIGKRSEFVAMNPNHYEFAPAGSLDLQFSPIKQVILELEEEIGIVEKEILQIKPIALIKDLSHYYAEIVFKIELLPNSMEKAELSEEEYTSIIWMTKKQLEQHLFENESEYVPMSAYIIENASDFMI